MLELVGIPAAARRAGRWLSMGMRQRLGLAAALLGDPQVLLLDEPANGLDPEGIRWLRQFLRHLSSQGRTVLVSSHMLSEVEQTVDDVVIIANGRFVRQGSMASLHGEQTSVVATTDAVALAGALDRAGLTVTVTDPHHLTAAGGDLRPDRRRGTAAGLPIHELRAHRPTSRSCLRAHGRTPRTATATWRVAPRRSQPSAAREGAML